MSPLTPSKPCALITGSTRGIGRAIAEEFVEFGYVVAINSRSRRDTETTANLLSSAVAIPGDVSTFAGAVDVVERAQSLFGGLDVLVCNVGSGKSGDSSFGTPKEWGRVFDLNFYSAVHCIEAALPTLAVNDGSIVCVSSICGIEAIPNAPIPYSVAKAALNAYVRLRARDFSSHGVRINAVIPGNIIFDGSVWWDKRAESQSAVDQMLAEQVPVGRFGTPAEIARAVRFLASGDSAFTTGSLLVVDGGQTRVF